MIRLLIFYSLVFSFGAAQLPGEDVTLRNGRTLEDFKIYNHSKWDAMVSHSGGVENIELSLFPKEMQARLGYSADNAEEAREEQNKMFKEAPQSFNKNWDIPSYKVSVR